MRTRFGNASAWTMEFVQVRDLLGGKAVKPVCLQVILEMVKHMKKFDGASTFWHLPPDERKALMNMVRH